MKPLFHLAEKGFLPDGVIRAGIKQICRSRLRREARGSEDDRAERFRAFIQHLHESPIAVATDAANQQHYELPPEFFQQVLGQHLKYSCCYYPAGVTTLDDAEEAMLDLTCRHGKLADGMEILELGCGWGSLTLWMAAQYPHARIQAVSNSRPQREFIEEQARRRGLANVSVVTSDMNHFVPGERFDRVVSVEMFEHMRNVPDLLHRISGWLNPHGKLLVHIFTHHRYAYIYEVEDETDWMARYFFTGGMMPSDDLLLHLQEHLVLEDHWTLDGTHYEKTANAWLANLDRNMENIRRIMGRVYGTTYGPLWLQRWRIFFMACAELWGFRRGREWIISHYRFTKRT